ncbi:sulfite exporter TauE/SafE family protein [Thiohalorhabdus sp. Cl-TMA]|uniref:Probable membrane transporter protein n=1 Tax=Thiohalorhabdus methylotrophus TaxID=3242694 RepID=A0ABV4TQK7_9GAMM
MNLYLPVAEMSVNIFVLLGLGGIVGVLSGLFGVGGGFLLTPLLMMLGIPAPVAAATDANQIVAASISGTIAHMRRMNVDFKMGAYMVVGGLVGSKLGVGAVEWLKALGQIDFVITVLFVVMLGTIGSFMFVEGLRAWRGGPVKEGSAKPVKEPRIRLPLRTEFPTSGLETSVLVPLGVGGFVGVLAAIMGVGGGFIMVPAMIYLIGMPTQVVVGTSLFQILFTTANTTFWQSVQNQTVDIVLALLLLIGSVVGAQVGTRMGSKLQGEQLRILLALIVLATAFKLLLDLVMAPSDMFVVGGGGGH